MRLNIGWFVGLATIAQLAGGVVHAQEAQGGGGWQVGGSPVPTANYMAARTEFTVPVNLGVAKTFLLGSMPLKTTLQGQYFVTRRDVAGPSWGVFFQITPVVKVPW